MSENLKHMERAKATLSVLEGHGEDMRDIRHVVHYFYRGNFGALRKVLEEQGYEVRPTVNNDGVIAERHEAIGEDWRMTTLADLCRLADTYGVEYDGWEASVTRKKRFGWLSRLLRNPS